MKKQMKLNVVFAMIRFENDARNSIKIWRSLEERLYDVIT